MYRIALSVLNIFVELNLSSHVSMSSFVNRAQYFCNRSNAEYPSPMTFLITPFPSRSTKLLINVYNAALTYNFVGFLI